MFFWPHPNAFYLIIALGYGLILLVQWNIGIDDLCGKFWAFYTSIMDNNKMWIILSVILVTFILYWLISGLFLIYDIWQVPESFRKYKVQPKTNEPVDKEKLFKAIKVVLFNQLVVNSVAIGAAVLLIEKYQLWNAIDITTVPSFPRLMFNFLCFNVIYEVIFYFNHRLVHHRLLYKHIHKMHHEWTSPIAAVSQYCHPVEHVLCNLYPLCGPILMQTDVASAFFFIGYMVFYTCLGHSGLHLPFMVSPEMHDYHHEKFNECFGTHGFLDGVFGTSENFLKSENAKKHHLTITFKAMVPVHVSESVK